MLAIVLAITFFGHCLVTNCEIIGHYGETARKQFQTPEPAEPPFVMQDWAKQSFPW